jgi:hypothetical protein
MKTALLRNGQNLTKPDSRKTSELLRRQHAALNKPIDLTKAATGDISGSNK